MPVDLMVMPRSCSSARVSVRRWSPACGAGAGAGAAGGVGGRTGRGAGRGWVGCRARGGARPPCWRRAGPSCEERWPRVRAVQLSGARPLGLHFSAGALHLHATAASFVLSGPPARRCKSEQQHQGKARSAPQPYLLHGNDTSSSHQGVGQGGLAVVHVLHRGRGAGGGRWWVMARTAQQSRRQRGPAAVPAEVVRPRRVLQ